MPTRVGGRARDIDQQQINIETVRNKAAPMVIHHVTEKATIEGQAGGIQMRHHARSSHVCCATLYRSVRRLP